MKLQPGEDDPAKQAVLRLAADLARALKSITRDRSIQGFGNLINAHPEKFSDVTSIHHARKIRNCIAHDEPVTNAQLQRAEVAFELALDEILPCCPELLRDKIKRRRATTQIITEVRAPGVTMPTSPPPPTSEQHKSQEQDATSPRLDQGPTSQPLGNKPFDAEPESQKATSRPVQPPPESPKRSDRESNHRLWSSSGRHPDSALQLDVARNRNFGTIWYLLALASLLIAAFAYAVRQHDGEKLVIAADPPTLSVPRPVPAQSRSLPIDGPRSQFPTEVPSPATPDRREVFRRLINTNLTASSNQPTLALLIDSTGPDTPTSVIDLLHSSLGDTAKVRVIANLADLHALKSGGFFDDLYGGNGQFLTLALQLSRVDYILLGKTVYSFRRQPELDQDLLTCELILNCRLVDHAGTIVQSNSFSGVGAGFTQATALEIAAGNTARQLKEMLSTIQ